MDKWQVLAERPLLDRRPWLAIREQDVRLPNGTIIEGYLRAESREFVVICALLANGTVPMVSQYKHGAGQAILDLPAGYLDEPGEPPLEAAQRELHEETGVTAARWQPLGRYLLDTNRGPMAAHFFLALDAQRLHEQALDETEDISVSFHRLSELGEMVFGGQVASLSSAAGIMFATAALARLGIVTS